MVDQEKEEEQEAIKLFHGGVVVSDARCWPSPGDLAFFRAVQAVFPVSDFQHVVVSPAQLLLGQFLVQCPIRGPKDVIACLCTCQLLLDFCKDASRFPPEVVLALEALTNQLWVPDTARAAAASKKTPWVVPQIWLAGQRGELVPRFEPLRARMKNTDFSTSPQLDMKMLAYDSKLSTKSSSPAIAKALSTLLGQLTDVCRNLPCCDVILQNIHDATKDFASAPPLSSKKKSRKEKQGAEGDKEKDAIQELAAKLASAIADTRKSRKAMRLMDVAAKSIRVIEPMYNENYKMTKDGHDPDKYRVQMKKLKKDVKRERKGVARELRKDAQFISAQRSQEKQSRMSELRAERIRNYNMLSQDAGEMNKAVRVYGATGGGSSAADLRGKRRKTQH